MLKKHFTSLSIFQILAAFRRGIFYFFLSIYLKENLGVSNTIMTLYATLPMIANILAQSLLWGRISDKFKKRRLLIVFGELYAAVGYVSVFYIHKIIGARDGLTAAAFAIIIGFTVIEAGWSSSNLGWTTLIADLTEEKERSKIMGQLQFIGGIGNILGVTASGFLYQGGKGFSEGYLFFISSGIMVFSIIALLLIPESYIEFQEMMNKKGDITQSIQRNIASDNSNNQNVKWDWNIFAWLLIIIGVVNIGGNSINQILQIYIRLPTTFNASDIIVAQLRNTSSAAMIIGGLIIGPLSRVFGDSKMLFSGFLLLFIATISLPFAPHISIIFIYMTLIGTSRVWIQTTSYSLVTKIVPLSIRGKMMGYYNAAFYLSWGLGGTLITGPVADSIVSSNKTVLTVYTYLIIIFMGYWIFMFIKHYSKIINNKRINNITTSIVIILSAIIASLLSKSIVSTIISYGTSDAIAYIVTFYIASLLVFIGCISYLFLRPHKFNEICKNETVNKDSQGNLSG